MERPTRRSRAGVAILATLAFSALIAVMTTIGSAAPSRVQYAPVNTGEPRLSGTARVNSTLTTSNGSWRSDSNLSYSYQWLRCNQGGDNCNAIAGATGQSYRVQQADVANRLRARVTARNNDGSSAANSNASAIVQQASAPGSGSTIPVTAVVLPDRLVVDRVEFSESPIRTRDALQARFRITNTRGVPVSGALVYASAIPFGRIIQPAEVTTGADGWATMTIQPTRLLPLKNGFLLTMFVRARKQGDDILAGVSSRRLISVRTANPRG